MVRLVFLEENKYSILRCRFPFLNELDVGNLKANVTGILSRVTYQVTQFKLGDKFKVRLEEAQRRRRACFLR